MPCSSGNGPDEEQMRYIRHREDMEFEAKYGTRDPDKLRNMLCRVLNGLDDLREKFRFDVVLPEEIQEWWKKHKKWDIDSKDNK